MKSNKTCTGYITLPQTSFAGGKNGFQSQLIRYHASIDADALNQSLTLGVNGLKISLKKRVIWSVTFDKFCIPQLRRNFTFHLVLNLKHTSVATFLDNICNLYTNSFTEIL